jgi:hypothetical protein
VANEGRRRPLVEGQVRLGRWNREAANGVVEVWLARSLAVAFALAAAAALTLALAVSTANSASASEGSRSCPVTIPPKREAPPGAGFSAAAFNYGNAHLRVELYWSQAILVAGRLPDGGSMAVINREGSIYVKVGWWRGVSGQLVVRGQRT